jgi:ligand-binding SRPBCC domain-containing protein
MPSSIGSGSGSGQKGSEGDMKTYVLDREQVVPRPLDEVFAFFADPGNLEALTPGFLHFRVLTPRSTRMETGAVFEYRLRLFGVPLGWKSRIDAYDPPRSFTDVQLDGPYASWVHVHEFRPVPGGVLVRDTVRYALGRGPLGSLAHALFVRRSLARIFDYRAQKLSEHFGAPPRASNLPARASGT